MVAFGIKPERAETGYGYIHRGSAMTEHPGIYQIAEFVEKPDAATAKKYLSGGVHDWNSGMFLFSAAAYIKELERLEPEIISQCQAAIDAAATDLDFIRLDPVAFAAAPSKSIDYAVMEHTDKAAVVPAEMGWNDVGSWTALWEIGTQDSSENVLLGNVIVLDSSRSYVRSEGPLVAALGIEDLVVVATPDAVLVLPRDRAQDVKTIVDELKSRGRDEAIAHPRVYRPWGFYQTLHDGERFQVKRITVNQGASLSLQMHHHRAEHWIVVNGAALVRNGNEEFTLKENESTYIPPTTLHRLSNPGKVPLNLIEVQSGSYLGEDDIVRYEDDYGRG
jgi:mannose-1-phosphate guanylyltransferase/mannose-6-phosphate isomerase